MKVLFYLSGCNFNHDTTNGHYLRKNFIKKPSSIEQLLYRDTITKGVKIGNHCVIGANSFVNKDIPDNCIAFGTPAKVVGKVLITKNGEIKLCYDK